MARTAAIKEKNTETVPEVISPTEDIKETKPESVVSAVVKKTTPSALTDNEEIEIISLVRNVSYYDKINGDRYAWENAEEVLTVPWSVIKTDLWRNHKGYFRNMYLRPCDERVIKELKLESLYSKYDDLLKPENYTGANVGKMVETIKSLHNDIRISICNRIKTLVADKKITDGIAIMQLGKYFNIDLLSLLS